jgi:hypothetical protein
LAPADKGRFEKMFEPWHERADLEKLEFNNVTFLNWYNHLIDVITEI